MTARRDRGGGRAGPARREGGRAPAPPARCGAGRLEGSARRGLWAAAAPLPAALPARSGWQVPGWLFLPSLVRRRLLRVAGVLFGTRKEGLRLKEKSSTAPVGACEFRRENAPLVPPSRPWRARCPRNNESDSSGRRRPPGSPFPSRGPALGRTGAGRPEEGHMRKLTPCCLFRAFD